MQTSWAVPSADHGFQATGESSYFSLTGSPAQHESPSSLWAGAGAAGFPSSPVPVSFSTLRKRHWVRGSWWSAVSALQAEKPLGCVPFYLNGSFLIPTQLQQ